MSRADTAKEAAIGIQALNIARTNTCAEMRELRALSTAGQPSRAIIILAEKVHREFYCGARCRKAGAA